jgi:hypothetical protein
VKLFRQPGAPTHDVAARTPRWLAVPGRARMPRHRSDQRSEARAAATVQLGPVTHPWRPRLVTRGLRTHTGGRTAIRHWPLVCCTSPIASASCRRHYRPRSYVATASTCPWAIKPPAPFSSRARAVHRRPPLAPPANSHCRLRP